MYLASMLDNYRHKGLRKQLVEIVESKGITSVKVLAAINKVPRHLFLDKAFEEQAYKDKALPILSGQTISQPYTVAYQTELLDPQPTDKILEIGTGSGYQAAVLSHLCKKIYSIERQKELFDHTSEFLNALGYTSIRTLYGDGYLGSPRFAIFDKILVTAGATFVPPALLEQLSIGGYIVIPSGSSEVKTMKRIIKTSAEDYVEESYGEFKFVPFLQGVVAE